MALLSYVNSDISKKTVHCWQFDEKLTMKKIIIIIIKITYQIQGRVVQVLLKTARSTRKNQM